MPTTPTRSSWAFPPSTRKVQLDEKWSFVAKKEKNCDWEADPDDLFKGDQYDHVAFDPDSRLVLSVLVGKRLAENADHLAVDVARRLGGRAPELITTDEYAPYKEAIEKAFGRVVTPPRTGKPGRPAGPRLETPAGLNYATVNKSRQKGRVSGVTTRVVLGALAAVQALLRGGAISTSYLERQHGTDRHRCARKGRKTYRFSKDWGMHVWATYFSLFSYNFCWPVRTLRHRGEDGRQRARTPAMAAGLTDHIWSLKDWVTFPAYQRRYS
jgi:IS1 family transposase